MRLNFINKIYLSLIAFSLGNLSAAEGASCFGPTKEKEFTANEYILISHIAQRLPLIIHIDSVLLVFILFGLSLSVCKKQALGNGKGQSY